MNKAHHISLAIRSVTVLLIFFSIVTTYYVMVIQRDYVIEVNEDGGPDTSDYFEELGVLEA
ncbi:MAG: hypothetical protein AAGA35_00415 [Patescibacteria group bacterium]